MLAYSVKSVPLNFPPQGAIKGGDAELFAGQELLGDVAVEDSFHPQRSRHRGIVHAQKTFGTNPKRAED